MIIYIFLAFILSLCCGMISTPLIQNYCKKKKLYDLPNSRKVHRSAIPRLGGISFLPSMLMAFLAATLTFNTFTGVSEVTFSLWSLYFLISLLLIYVVGIVDDVFGLGASMKFLVQILASSLLPLSGLYINNLYGLFGVHDIPYWIGAPLTIFIIVFICNSINLIDGIDGLAGGLSFIALGGFLFCFINEDVWLYCVLIAGLMGVVLSFLYFNIFGNPEKGRKIFMGDSGSLTLGFILGFLAVKYSMDNPNVMFWRPDCLLLSYTFLIVPILDVIRVSTLRFFHHKPIFFADKNHIHHKLMRAGMNQHQALVTILTLAVFYIILNVTLNSCVDTEIVLALDILVWLVFHQVINFAIRKSGKPVFVGSKQNNE